MFDQIKDLYNLKKQAQEMQKQMEKERVSGSSNDGAFTITINGSNEVVEVIVSTETSFDHTRIEKNIKEAFTDAQAKLKSVMMEKFKGMM